VWKYGRRLRLGEEKKKKKKKERKKKPQGKNIMSASATQGGHNKCTATDAHDTSLRII